MIVIVDTREQQPFTFPGFPDVETRRETLTTGDYSLAGFESTIAWRRTPPARRTGRGRGRLSAAGSS